MSISYLVLDCKWGSYGAWTGCTVTCGGGSQTRTRTVETSAANGGSDCTGDASVTRDCNTSACPVGTSNMGFLIKLDIRIDDLIFKPLCKYHDNISQFLKICEIFCRWIGMCSISIILKEVKLAYSRKTNQNTLTCPSSL